MRCLPIALITLAACVTPLDETDELASAINGHVDPVRVHAILLADDDGSHAATATPADIQTAVTGAKSILAAAGIELTFDPQSDVTRISSTLLNQECTATPGADLTNKNVQPQDCAVNSDERNRVAAGFPGKLVLFFARGDRFVWSDGLNMWVWQPRTENWSNHVDQFVVMLQGPPGGEVLAHEMGHYLHLSHTQFPEPKTIAEAQQKILAFVAAGNPIQNGANVFDNDGLDTPPDPGMALFSAAGLDPCNPADTTVMVPVNFPNNTSATYFLTPDRENIMSYWNKTCRGLPPHMTAGQIARVRDAVEAGNRQHLIQRKVLYSAVWEQGSRDQTRAIGWAFADITNRMNQELGAGRHIVHLQAYDIGSVWGGESTNRIRWDAVWEPGSTGQSWVLGWAFADIVKQHQAELAAGNHLVHMQAYDLGGGQLRWDAVWEPGSTSQSWVMGFAMKDVALAFDQNVAAGNHFVRMQAYDLGGGQMRWDAVWEPGARGTTRAIGWAMKDFAIRFDKEIAAGKHCVHMQAYDIGGGQIRWDGVWEDGPRNTSRAIGWAFNDFVGRLATESAAGRGLVHMQAYDVGDGQVRYDAVWESGTPTQHRILSESMKPFAARFDGELATNEMHLVLMQAHTGR